MNSYVQIVIQGGNYVAIYVVDGVPVSSQFCSDYSEAISIQSQWGSK